MRALSPIVLTALILAGMMPASLQADYLKNTDLKDGLTEWHGDGEAAFLKPDGTEGSANDKDVTPVIKISLAKGASRAAYQRYETHDNPNMLHIQVEVYASSDFKRSAFVSDYTTLNWRVGSTAYRTTEVTPNVDFWIRGAPGFIYKLSNLIPGEWVTVDAKWDRVTMTNERTVWFTVPPGEGTVYLKNPSVTP